MRVSSAIELYFPGLRVRRQDSGIDDGQFDRMIF